jgi:hypothetical protein
LRLFKPASLVVPVLSMIGRFCSGDKCYIKGVRPVRTLCLAQVTVVVALTGANILACYTFRDSNTYDRLAQVL